MTMLAYSPVLHLVDSHVAIYKIYVLKNPFTEEIFYVGQTLQELEMRLVGHMTESESNKAKNDYIQGIINQGGKPKIESIEVIQGTCYIDKMAVNEREIYWIKYYKALGCKLLNIASTHPNQKCNEYHNYLSSIKKGESSYHYYYCGKTAGGMKVYDEKRLNADGFRMPVPKPVQPNYEELKLGEYNPYQNPRWVKMICGEPNPYFMGTKETFDFNAYKDTDPNYYDDDY